MTSDLRYTVNPVLWAKECLSFEPDAWQARVLESPNNTLLNVCRQAGKSTTCAMLSLHRAVFFPKSLILVSAPSLRQSSELYRKITGFMSQLPDPPKLEEDNKLSCILSGNGSRIIALPGTEKTVRGYSGADLILLDEAARIPDELFFSVRPMLAVSGGRMVMLSTPFGRRGAFFEQYVNGDVKAWERIEVPADKCPRISPAFLEEEKQTLGPWFFDQEYYCRFNDTTDSVFSYDLIRAAIDPSVTPLFPRVNAVMLDKCPGMSTSEIVAPATLPAIERPKAAIRSARI